MLTLIKMICFIFATLVPTQAAQAIRLGVDATFGALFPYQNHYRSYGYMMLGSSSFNLGLMGGLENPHSYVTDTFYGGVMRFGDKQALEVGAGLLERLYTGEDQTGTSNEIKAKGSVVILSWSLDLSRFWRITFPMVIKQIQESDGDRLAERTSFELTPYLGVRLL